MSNQVIRDQKRRLLVAKYELKRMQYKAICQDRALPNQIRYEYTLKLAKLPRNSSKTRVRNRCILTGRSRSVYKLFRVSRIVFRELASRGALYGINKSSW
jgi:ribosomal protein S14|uniref:Small ribosomal subunit protein uS14m n=2 Tax=Characeae TaxID=3146 RepID=Q7YAL3_CHAVU|nr:ribosomal protein S14 [Chara vulgaris]AAP92193.1 ribosomal protein S14 [Chara vulgaris]QXT44739.1 ribosomal protein S14 [Nitellopsis obtusa]WAK98773.1 ribosomal protein S14 [Chara vulgaris]